MKRLFALSLGLGLLSPLTGFAVTLQHHNFVNVGVEQQQLSIEVGYPGMRGKSCGIELRSSRSYGVTGGLKQLSEALAVTSGFNPQHLFVPVPRLRGQTLRYDFDAHELNTYVSRFELRTRTGESLADAVRRTVPKSIWTDAPVEVIAELVDCEK